MLNAEQLDWFEAKYAGETDKLLFKNGAGEIMMEFPVPNGLLRKLIDANASSCVSVHLDGTVHSAIDPSVELAISSLPIDELVARDTAAGMLKDEPDTTALLQLFEKRLKRSLDLVGSALDQVQLQNKI